MTIQNLPIGEKIDLSTLVVAAPAHQFKVNSSKKLIGHQKTGQEHPKL